MSQRNTGFCARTGRKLKHPPRPLQLRRARARAKQRKRERAQEGERINLFKNDLEKRKHNSRKEQRKEEQESKQASKKSHQGENASKWSNCRDAGALSPQKPALTGRPSGSLRIQSGCAFARAECLSMAPGNKKKHPRARNIKGTPGGMRWVGVEARHGWVRKQDHGVGK